MTCKWCETIATLIWSSEAISDTHIFCSRKITQRISIRLGSPATLRSLAISESSRFGCFFVVAFIHSNVDLNVIPYGGECQLLLVRTGSNPKNKDPLEKISLGPCPNFIITLLESNNFVDMIQSQFVAIKSELMVTHVV